jgi:hypothetical protein
MRWLLRGGQWLLPLLALWAVWPATAQSPNDASFLSTLNELREASYSDKENIVERLSQSGHPSVRAVLTALLEDRLYFRNSDQKVFIVKTAEGWRIDPYGSTDSNRHKQRFEEGSQDGFGALWVSEPGRFGAVGCGA